MDDLRRRKQDNGDVEQMNEHKHLLNTLKAIDSTDHVKTFID